ncbi:hypothetical protein, partial [Cupriavidus sp. UYPR2.512]|uniref:hypothetical protein n=1 Tax=Cupriavidus sp. UYPR2.512 TaxID=1080187 RepID=UPI000568D2DF
EIQIVDTHGILTTRVSIGFQANDPQINRTLVVEDFFEDRGGADAPTRKPEVGQTASTPTRSVAYSSARTAIDYAEPERAETVRIARDRVLLLAAKYAKGENQSEVVARLEILNSRLLEREPRVSQAQVQALEAAAAQVSEARAKREAMMRRLGLI